jgi:hypothetical protein
MRVARELLINGVITGEEFELLSKLHGPSQPRTLRKWVVQVAPWAGYAVTAATGIAQIVAHFRPELKGPLESLIETVGVLVSQ